MKGAASLYLRKYGGGLRMAEYVGWRSTRAQVCCSYDLRYSMCGSIRLAFAIVDIAAFTARQVLERRPTAS